MKYFISLCLTSFIAFAGEQTLAPAKTEKLSIKGLSATLFCINDYAFLGLGTLVQPFSRPLA